MMFSKHLFKKGSFTLQKSSIEKIEPLWRLHPWVENEDDFWYEPSSGEWFVKEYF